MIGRGEREIRGSKYGTILAGCCISKINIHGDIYVKNRKNEIVLKIDDSHLQKMT